MLSYIRFAYLPSKMYLFLKITCSLLAFIALCLILQDYCSMPEIHSHQGDGQFTNISRQLGPFSRPGYSIKMPPFDLDKPRQARFRLAKLPAVPRRCCVYFAISTDDDNWQHNLRRNLRATLLVELCDSSGHVLMNPHGNLSDYTAYSSSLMDFIALYPWEHTISFFPAPSENYTVSMAYSPDPKLMGYKGFLYLESGGSK